MTDHLPANFTLDLIEDPLLFWQEVGDHFKQVFSNRRSVDTKFFLNEEEKSCIEKNKQRFPQEKSFCFVLRYKNQLAGWHIGDIKSPEVFDMRNSAVLEKFRGQGLYEKMMLSILDHLKAQGFQVVTSLHHGNNAAILIPKLRHGFIISGSELHERFGFMVKMKYFFNFKRRQSYSRQIGLKY